MIGRILLLAALSPLITILPSQASAQVAGESGPGDLKIADGGLLTATVVISPTAGEWEKRAADDLVAYIQRMTGARPKLANTDATITAALNASEPVPLVGAAALSADPSLLAELEKVAKPNPVLRADAIVLRRKDNRVYVAGNNDDSHYYAVTELLSRWGCRWYLPGKIGECIPSHPTLKVGKLDHAYAPPFEARRYWLSWNGDSTGRAEFMRRNYFSDVHVPSGHSLAQYTKELIPPDKTMFNVPISEENTA